MNELKPGTQVRMKSGTEGWIRGRVVEYTELMPAVGGYVYTGPGYKVFALEGKHKGETLRLPANYIEPMERAEAKPEVKGVEDCVTGFSHSELAERARKAGLSVEGGKRELCHRLLAAGVL